MSGRTATRAIGIVLASAGLIFVMLFAMVGAGAGAPWGIPAFSLILGIILILAGSFSPPKSPPVPVDEPHTDDLDAAAARRRRTPTAPPQGATERDLDANQF